jgi:peptide deformylase
VILDILQHPDPRLAEVCTPVGGIDTQLIEDMFATMYNAPGRGLAAPQIGTLQRLFVMDATWKDGDMTPMAFVNPVITGQGGNQVNEEACLSIADFSRNVSRPEWVEVSWTGIDGTAQNARFDGFSAACICHEIDHLDGKLILDHQAAA